MYGLTECKRCTYLPPEQLKARPGSVGIAIPNTEVYVVDDQGQPVKPGVVGELVIRGGHVMKGYWEKPEATQKVLRPGRYPWENVLYTGDLFQTDAEGYLYFVGRKDDIIKTRGEKVSPKEVENVLYALHGVREATVIGVPDAVLGMALKAVIVPVESGGLSEQQVIRHWRCIPGRFHGAQAGGIPCRAAQNGYGQDSSIRSSGRGAGGQVGGRRFQLRGVTE